jgi:homoserine O-acetyltransferase
MEAAIDKPPLEGPLSDAERKALARCRHAVLGVERPLRLDCGVELGPYRVAYQTYGTLNGDKSNAVLICHALTGSADVDAWWPDIIGAGKALDPRRDFIVCSNILGSCYGTTGPVSPRPGSSARYRAAFPRITVRDMVEAQRLLLDHLGVQRLAVVTGPSPPATPP